MKIFRLFFICSGVLFGFQNLVYGNEFDIEAIRKCLVRVTVTGQRPNYRAPWNPGSIGGGVGSGFIIFGSRIMTNAHVVSNARYINVDKDGDSHKYPARIVYIAHDCDLALLTVDNPNFFKDTNALEFGEIPALHSTVTAYGYPIGGERMSATRGVISRIEFRTYSHSGLDAHLTVQVDAAINPGNSGGPVVQDQKVVGVAFQGYSGAVAQNTGYIIPTPVIRRFLQDITDGRYDGYVELGIDYLNLLNPSYRDFLKLQERDTGVIVTNVLAAGSAGKVLKKGDVLLSIDGYPITNDGHIEIDGEYVQMEEVVERKFHGDIVTMEIIRDDRRMSVDITLKGAWPYAILAKQYDIRPEFVLFAGLLFQPLSRNFLGAYKNKDLDLNYYYAHYISDEIYLERPQIIVLSAILPDPVNTHIRAFVNSIVDEINGIKIKTMEDVAEVLDEPSDIYVIRMLGKGKPIVIEHEQVEASRQRIKDRYGVTTERYLREPFTKGPRE